MALSLAEKLGLKANLLAFSIHPGVVKETNLADYSRPDPTNDGLGKDIFQAISAR